MNSIKEGAAGKKWGKKGCKGNWTGRTWCSLVLHKFSGHQPGRQLSLQVGCAKHLEFSHMISLDSVELYTATLLLRLLVSSDT